MKRLRARRSGTARRGSGHPVFPYSGPDAMTPFFKIIRQCLENFVRRFGRYPNLDEPLLFDPQVNHPVCASRREMRSQIIAAAKAADVDAGPLLAYLGLGPNRTKSSDLH